MMRKVACWALLALAVFSAGASGRTWVTEGFEAFVADRGLIVSSVRVEPEIPAKTWVKALVRVNGGAWTEPAGVRLAKGDRLQCRLELGALNSLQTPRVRRVDVSFNAGR